MANDLVIVSDKVTATKNGLVIKGDFTFKEWEEVGKKLNTIEGAVHWWIGDWLNYGERAYGEMYAQAVEETGYDISVLQNDKWVAGVFETSTRVEELTWTHHREVASMEKEERKELLGLAKQFGWTTRTLGQEVQKYKVSKALSEPEKLNGKYRIIYADPPWQYNSGEQSKPIPYPTMSIQELCELPISGMAENNAVLFMWVTSPLLAECFDVIKAWGFEYKTSIIWDKQSHNVGYYVSVRHELILICTRGSCRPDTNKLLPSVVSEKRLDHSVKPETFRKMIDTMYPHGKRIELFARRKAENWDVWGNDGSL